MGPPVPLGGPSGQPVGQSPAWARKPTLPLATLVPEVPCRTHVGSPSVGRSMTSWKNVALWFGGVSASAALNETQALSLVPALGSVFQVKKANPWGRNPARDCACVSRPVAAGLAIAPTL
jgi:hypothetical protein